MSNPRQIALEALIKTQRDGAFSNLAIDAALSKSELDTRDKSFVSNLFYGVIERQLTIDYQLSRYLSKPLKKLKPEVIMILRLGAYQILFMDKVPDSAAVNESIKLSKKNGASYASGLINAVLRKVSQNGIILPESTESEEYLSVKFSCPLWLTKKWISEYGYEDTAAFLESSVGSADTFIRVNTTKTTDDELIENILNELTLAFDFNRRGGATFLGTKKTVIKMHGCATEQTPVACIDQLLRLEKSGFSQKIKTALESL